MEGSRLTHDQTRYIFETNTIGIHDKTLNVDDIVETVNHFNCIDQIIESANYQLNESLIKQLHAILKSGTSDSRKTWFTVGDYKRFENEVGGRPTTKPADVSKEMKRLLQTYNLHKSKTLQEIIAFHYEFEKIHPFQDAHVIIGTRLEKPSKINGFALLSPIFFIPCGVERGRRRTYQYLLY